MTSPLIASVLHLDKQAIHQLRISDPYSLHRVVYGLFPDIRTEAQKESNIPSGIVFADMGSDFTGRKVLLLSDRQPIETTYGQIQSKIVPDSFLEHDRYRFKVIVNPTRRDNLSKKLIPVKGRAAVAEWFLQRSCRSWGFECDPEQLLVHKIDVLRFKDKHQHDVTLAQAHIEGVLTVKDRQLFRESFAQGIGRGRAFGTGLLQITPVTDSIFA